MTIPVPTVWATCEPQEGDEIEEGRPGDKDDLRPQHPGRDDGRDRIGGVVQAVQEIEQDRDEYQEDDEREAGVQSRLPLTSAR